LIDPHNGQWAEQMIQQKGVDGKVLMELRLSGLVHTLDVRLQEAPDIA